MSRQQELQNRINRLILMYQEAGLNLLDLIRSLEEGTGRRRKEQILMQVDDEINRLTALASAEQAVIISMAYRLGVAETVTALRASGVLVNDSIKPLIHHRAAQAILDESFYSILEASDHMSLDTKQRIEEVVRKANQRSLLEGVSRRQATKDAIAELTQREITGIITRNGARVPADKYIHGVVQYHQRKAHVTGQKNMATQNKIDLVYVNYVGITCEYCATMQGRVYSISGEDRRFPELTPEREPPYHSHCVHNLRPWVESAHTQNQVKRMIRDSNRPFVDNRTQQNIKRYNELQREKSRKNETRKQWMRYKAVLPNDTPDLRQFASQKARGTKKYQELQELYRKVNKEIKLEGG